jgi:peptidoglycan hydrolase CwlO-like protein
MPRVKKIFSHFSKPVLFLGMILILASINFKNSVAEENLDEICQLEKIDEQCGTISQQDCQTLLEKCKKFYEEKSSQLETDIKKAGQKEKSYENQIYILKNKINKLKNQIDQSNLIIKDLNFQIGDTESSIEKTSLKIDDSRQKLAEILAAIHEEDQKSLIEVLLSEKTLSGFFDNLVNLGDLDSKSQELLEDIKELKSNLETQKQSLDKEKNDLENQVLVQTLQKEESEKTKKDQEYLLGKTKGEKALYQEYLKDVQEKAKEIRKRIFELAQIPEAEAPTLEEAYKLAKFVETMTGVRPALLLGLLQVESAIGQNVGQCNCPYCKHPEISWRTVMTKSQWDSFLEITRELNINPDAAPVSCWVGEGRVQMGGAMGPAQFMPNTWLKVGYKKRVEETTGQVPANPWRVQDAFLAAGFYLADRGAASQKLSNEIGAVTAYLCGTSSLTSKCKAAGGDWYRKLVMEYAAEFQGYVESGVFENNK